jgi:methionine-S-sulfoxide reductase
MLLVHRSCISNAQWCGKSRIWLFWRKVKNPTYKEVCAGTTGHAEVVQITFDNTKTSVEEILKVFFTVHDPTTLNRQGADEGTQYRSAIFYHNQNQYKIAKGIIDELNKVKAYPKANCNRAYSLYCILQGRSLSSKLLQR